MAAPPPLPPAASSSSASSAAGPSLADIKKAISCVDAANALFFCASPAHQVERYYKDGALDGCDAQIGELKLCLRLKLAGEAEARAIVQQLVGRAATQPPSIGRVWQARAAAPAAPGGSDGASAEGAR
jgi:hypothetical protein